MTKREKEEAIQERLRVILFRAVTWGQKEALAGVADRNAWWKGRTEEQASAELRRMIEERLRKGEIQ